MDRTAKLSTNDALWAIMLGYADYLKTTPKPISRRDWLVWWFSARIHSLNDDLKVQARKILADDRRTMVGDDGTVVSVPEFIVDSLFALNVGIKHLPPYATKISQHWIDTVKAKSLLSNSNKLHS